jgi:RimJ/RimL family protein N-acetyltransferase
MDQTLQIVTPRLRIVAATAEHVQLEIADRASFARILDCVVPEIWPPESAADALPWFLERLTAEPENVGWYAWYAILKTGQLIGGAGFLGSPVDGVVETGFSLLKDHQGCGFAREIMDSLTHWAFSDDRVQTIAAETHDDNAAARRLLTRLGFHDVAPGREPGTRRYALVRPDPVAQAPLQTRFPKK